MSQEFVTSAFRKDGDFKVRNRQALDAWVAKQRDGEFTLTVSRLHATRSLESNALYWVGYVKPLSDHTGYTPNEMHAYLKARFLPTEKRRVKRMLLHDRNGVVIDDYELDLSTTTDLNKLEFSDYLREIGIFAASLGVDVGSNREAA